MGMTMTQKILAAAAGKHEVKEGELIMANLSLVLGNEHALLLEKGLVVEVK